MKKLFQTFCVLLAISSQANATSTKSYRNLDVNRLLPFSEQNQTLVRSKDLDGLYNIQSIQSRYIEQPYSEFSQLYKNAIAAQTELESIAESVALQSGTAVFSSGMKSKLRAINKINTKLAGDHQQITDLVRTSIVAKDIPELLTAFELITQEAEVLSIKNRFKSPEKSGYRDLSMLIRLPNSQIVAELQLHLQAFSVIKNGKEHDNYEQIQQIERIQFTDKRALNKLEEMTIDKLRKESKQMYQQAWNQYLSA